MAVPFQGNISEPLTESQDKQVAIVGHGGAGRKAMTSLLALDTVISALPGGYESYTDIVRTMKEFGYFHKHYRNRPDLMRPKAQGRNEKCNCGSGKKYKYCCGR